MTETEIDPYTVVESHWPYDGPHSGDSVSAAVTAIDRLVRYLNNATGPGHRGSALPYAATAYRIIRGLTEMADLLPQLLGQLGMFLEKQAGDVTLYDDRRDRPAANTAIEAVIALQESTNVVGLLAEQLHAASRAASHLGNDDSREG